MKRLIAVQQGLRISKDKSGDGGRFKYRTAEDILEKAKPLLAEQNLAITLTDTLMMVGERIFLETTATLWGEERELMEVKAVAELDKHLTKNGNQSMSNEQCTGSASSYARKYALCGLFAIDNSEQDPDEIVKSLTTRIALAQNAHDMNLLLAEINDASEEDKKSFNAQIANLGLTWNEEKKQFVKQ